MLSRMHRYDRAVISTPWHAASVAAGGGSAALAYPFDSLLNLSSVWAEGCGVAAYINPADCSARQSGSSSAEEQGRVRETAVLEAPCSQFARGCQQFGPPQRLNHRRFWHARWARERFPITTLWS